jgi:hypothetical protein
VSAYWSYLLTAVGVFGLYLAGRKDRRGWMVGIGAQVLWVAYAVSTHQWGFLVSAGAYGWVYARNAHAWKPRGATEADDLVTLWHIALAERDKFTLAERDKFKAEVEGSERELDRVRVERDAANAEVNRLAMGPPEKRNDPASRSW